MGFFRVFKKVKNRSGDVNVEPEFILMVAPVEHQKIKKHVFEGPLHSVYMGDFEDFFKNGQKPHFYPFLTKMAKSDILEPS